MQVLPTTYYLLLTRRGQAVLSLVFVIGGITVIIGLTMAFLATSFVSSAYGFQTAQRAQAVVISGAQDALLQLSRNKDFCGASGCAAYGVTVGNDTATVTVTQDSPSTGLVTIVSTATVSLRQKKIKVILSRASSTGQISLVSWQQQ